jgi:tetratricopeptide (TPR) repeat protein
MDGRVSVLWLGLALFCSGCITTTEKNVTIRRDDEPSPERLAGTKDEKPTPVTPGLTLAYAAKKEADANAIPENPQKQAQLRDEARRAYQDLIRREADNVAAYRGLARVYARMKDFDRARETYQKALAKHPREIMLWYDLGMMHNCRKDWAEGIKCFRKALEIDGEHQETLKAMGFTLARSGQFDQSVTYLSRAMGSTAAAHYNVALMLLHLGEQDPTIHASREELARQYLRHALAENPGFESARDLLARLDVPPSSGRRVEITFVPPGE